MTYSDRRIIEKMYNSDHSKSEIADTLGCTVQTVYNELKRGLYDHMNTNLTYTRKYSAEIAQADYNFRQTSKGAPLKIGKNRTLAEHIEHKIMNDKYSPAAVLAELIIKPFCTSTLYSYIDKGIFLHLTNKHLPEKRFRKRKYNNVERIKKPPKGRSIEERPKHVEERNTFGHWEMDTVIGKKSGKKQALLVLTERLSRYEIIMQMEDKSSNSMIAALNRVDNIHNIMNKAETITVDNGSEFANTFEIEHSKDGVQRTTLYHCHPYSSCERGSNERNNRIIRRFLPKGTSFEKLTSKQIDAIETWMNNYPRKVLGWKTPKQVFDEHVEKINKKN